MRCIRLIGYVLLLILLFSTAVFGANKSAVEPQVLSLPKGPGSIEGLGESFAPQLNTGTASYRVNLTIPPGINRHQPTLALVYNGGHGNSPLGIGWRLNIPSIQRQTDKGLPSYADSDTFIHSEGGELVPLEDGAFRFKIEGAFTKFMRVDEGWEVWEKNGTHHYFGSSENGRLQTSAGTFEWHLEKSVDTNGNTIIYLYDYEADGKQPYLKEIRYGLASDSIYQSVHFSYEPRPDAFTDYRSRQGILTAQRLKSVEMRSQGAPVRTYRLAYQDDSGLSLLSQVVQLGMDGTSALPPISFGYSAYDPERFKTMIMADPPPAGISLSNANADLIDADGDSLPDMIYTDTTYHQHRFYLNHGQGTWQSGGAVIPDASPPYYLYNSGVMMADMDGDGLADLYVKNVSETGYFKNRGQLSWGNMIDFNVNPNFNFENSSIKLLDVNNDKLIDVLFDDGHYYRVWLNPKDGVWNTNFDATTNLPNNLHLNLASSSVHLADMNGDRLEDLVRVLDGYVSYFPSKGFGKFDTEIAMTNPPKNLGNSAANLEPVDLNNDGLADLALVGNTQVRVWLNAGNGGFKELPTFTGTPTLGSHSGYRFADMDGDGFRDLLVTNENTDVRYQYVTFNQGIHPNLLTRISNGLGKETTIEYRSSTDDYLADRDAGKPWTRKLPFPVQVVSRVTVKDALSGQAYVTDYHYRDGYYNGDEKEFRGFAEVEEHEQGGLGASGLVVRHMFDVGDVQESRKGMLTSQAFLDEKGSISPPKSLYEIADHRLTTRTLLTGIDGRNVMYSFPSETRTQIYERGRQPKTLLRTWDRDTYGNVVRDFDYGLINGKNLAAGNDEILTQTKYRVDEQKWLLDRPREIRNNGLKGEFVSWQRLFYDTRGNLIRDERSPDGIRFIPVVRNQYDDHGNIVRITDANEHWRQIDYDEIFHAMPVRETIGDLNLIMKAEYDLGWGAMTSFTDPNGNETAFSYDVFGRLSAIVKPGDNADQPTQSFEYHLAEPVSHIVTHSREQSGEAGTYDTISYFDGLGRKIQTRSEAEAGQWAVTEAVSFNLRQGIRRQWLPYFSDSPDYAPSSVAKTHSLVQYDARGRSIKETNPDGSFRSTAYRPLKKIQSDEEDNRADGSHANTPLTYLSDGRNRLVEVQERNGAATYTTRYAYDGLNNLIGITDPAGNIKTLHFDGLGRKDFLNDPDKGVMHYDYDDAGNLLSTIDAKNQTVAYVYDAANRLLTEDSLGLKVRYHYDGDMPNDSADLKNTLGRLAWVEDEAGREAYSYDERGNIARKTRWLDGLRFDTGMEYDALDRLTTLTYPDASQVEYHYNAMNRLEAVPGYVDNIDYAASGQKMAFQYANGVDSGYEYDERQRLHRLSSEGPGGVLQDQTYRYDLVNNIVEIEDQRPAKTPEDRSVDYVYDDLYRLSKATAPSWNERYHYDNTGNMTFKSDVGNMRYGGGAGPHALTGAGSAVYGYDASGNLASKPGFNYRFDHQDRLVHVERNDGGIDFAYDSAGQRKRKSVQVGGRSETVLYVDRSLEIRGKTPVKQVYAGDRLVARVLGESGGSRTYFYLPDHLGNASVVTDALGNTVEESVFYPYGKNRVRNGTFKSEYRFTGQEFDKETGLYYFESRYYDPVKGRFISVDPLSLEKDGKLFANGYGTGAPAGLTGRMESYAYVANNPANHTDSSGLIIDTVADIGFVSYDLYRLASDGQENRDENLAALGADLVGTVTPFGTGFGLAVRAGIKAEKRLPDSALVCRGGLCTTDRFSNGSGVVVDSAGKLQNVSVNSASDKSIRELSNKLPNRKIGVTTVGDVRRAGGDVIASPTTNNPYHCVLCNITPKEAENLFTPVTNKN
ncbi:MAG: toxin TcdB middle/N-terminal domain-containing protein [Methylovulum sp.]|nr:toxin TcdB middle/N-terminal domain-containing protein [Methylovulum sp.]